MNEIIKKCIGELEKEEPRLDYIRGMLETTLALNEHFGAKPVLEMKVSPPKILETVAVPMDEASILEAQAKAAMTKMPPNLS